MKRLYLIVATAAGFLEPRLRCLHRRRIGRRNRSTFWSALVQVAELTSPPEFSLMDFRRRSVSNSPSKIGPARAAPLQAV